MPLYTESASHLFRNVLGPADSAVRTAAGRMISPLPRPAQGRDGTAGLSWSAPMPGPPGIGRVTITGALSSAPARSLGLRASLCFPVGCRVLAH